MSKKTDRQKERNQQYWKDRAERNILSAEKNADELLKIIKHSYNEANKLIREEIQNFYGRFTWKQGITYEETLQRLNRKELKLFQEQAKKYYDEAYAENWQTAYTDRMRTLSARAYMSRLEELKVNIYHQYQKIAEELNVQLGEGLSKQYESSFEDMMYNLAHTTGIGVQIPKINDAIVEKTIKEKWLGGNYSSRVWQNKDKLVDVLNKDLPVMFTLGKHPNVIAEHLSGKLENNFKNTVRLVRTEFNRVANESTADAYEKYGIEEYEFIATLDSKTSEICAELDNKRFKVNDRQVGVNYPPMHPNCRSTTIAYFDDEFSDRLAKDKDGKYFPVSYNTTYGQWKEMTNRGIFNSENMGKTSMHKSELPKNNVGILNAENYFEDVEKYIFNEIGFASVDASFFGVEKNLAIANLEQLSKLEKRFGIINESNVELLGENESTGAEAFTLVPDKTNYTKQALSLCSNYYQDEYAHILLAEQQRNTGWSMDFADEYANVYNVTHEYGHLISNSLIKNRMIELGWEESNSKRFVDNAKSNPFEWYDNVAKETNKEIYEEIVAIATGKNASINIDSYVSRMVSSFYDSNEYYEEFFADVFANSQLGKPNVLGDAMNEWLRRKGI